MKLLWTAIILMLLMACTEKPQRTSLFASDDGAARQARVTSARPMSLPDDHTSHPDYQLEWWYLTFVLEDAQERQYGLQFTLFRFATEQDYVSNWSDSQQWMGHASLHSPDNHWFESRFAAGGVGNAGVNATPFSATLDNWQWQSTTERPFPASLRFTIEDTVRVDISASPEGPYVKHGDKGISIKSAGGQFRSYYYSQPFLSATGELHIDEQVISVSGKAWYDHEWTSELARDDALGWDWFSIHFYNGDKLMAFQMHVNQEEPYTTGTYIKQDGSVTTLQETELTIRAVDTEMINDKPVPVKWNITSATNNLNITVAPFKPGQWNPGRFSYYEGRVEVRGSHPGSGFMELTGYQ